MTLLQKTLYIGRFIHCKTLTELDICDNGTIGVDENGNIAFVERQGADAGLGNGINVREGWEGAKVVRCDEDGFFFPGFIGMVYSFIFTPLLYMQKSETRNGFLSINN